MGEAKSREDQIKAMKAAEAEEQRKLQELLESPLSKEETAKAFADADVEQAKLLVVRQKWVAKQDAHRLGIAEAQAGVDECDARLAEIALSRNITYRRSLNAASEHKPAMGEPVRTA